MQFDFNQFKRMNEFKSERGLGMVRKKKKILNDTIIDLQSFMMILYIIIKC